MRHQGLRKRLAGTLEVDGRLGLLAGPIGKKGASYAASCRGVTNVWDVSRSWTAADR
jgi:hypothetical protein